MSKSINPIEYLEKCIDHAKDANKTYSDSELPIPLFSILQMCYYLFEIEKQNEQKFLTELNLRDLFKDFYIEYCKTSNILVICTDNNNDVDAAFDILKHKVILTKTRDILMKILESSNNINEFIRLYNVENVLKNTLNDSLFNSLNAHRMLIYYFYLIDWNDLEMLELAKSKNMFNPSLYDTDFIKILAYFGSIERVIQLIDEKSYEIFLGLHHPHMPIYYTLLNSYNTNLFLNVFCMLWLYLKYYSDRKSYNKCSLIYLLSYKPQTNEDDEYWHEFSKKNALKNDYFENYNLNKFYSFDALNTYKFLPIDSFIICAYYQQKIIKNNNNSQFKFLQRILFEILHKKFIFKKANSSSELDIHKDKKLGELVEECITKMLKDILLNNNNNNKESKENINEFQIILNYLMQNFWQLKKNSINYMFKLGIFGKDKDKDKRIKKLFDFIKFLTNFNQKTTSNEFDVIKLDPYSSLYFSYLTFGTPVYHACSFSNFDENNSDTNDDTNDDDSNNVLISVVKYILPEFLPQIFGVYKRIYYNLKPDVDNLKYHDQTNSLINLNLKNILYWLTLNNYNKPNLKPVKNVFIYLIARKSLNFDYTKFVEYIVNNNLSNYITYFLVDHDLHTTLQACINTSIDSLLLKIENTYPLLQDDLKRNFTMFSNLLQFFSNLRLQYPFQFTQKLYKSLCDSEICTIYHTILDYLVVKLRKKQPTNIVDIVFSSLAQSSIPNEILINAKKLYLQIDEKMRISTNETDFCRNYYDLMKIFTRLDDFNNCFEKWCEKYEKALIIFKKYKYFNYYQRFLMILCETNLNCAMSKSDELLTHIEQLIENIITSNSMEIIHAKYWIHYIAQRKDLNAFSCIHKLDQMMLDKRDLFNRSCIDYLIKAKANDILIYVIKFKKNSKLICELNMNGENIFHYAVKKCEIEVLDALFEYHDNCEDDYQNNSNNNRNTNEYTSTKCYNKKDGNDQTPFMIACSKVAYDNIDVEKSLLIVEKFLNYTKKKKKKDEIVNLLSYNNIYDARKKYENLKTLIEAGRKSRRYSDQILSVINIAIMDIQNYDKMYSDLLDSDMWYTLNINDCSKLEFDTNLTKLTLEKCFDDSDSYTKKEGIRECLKAKRTVFYVDLLKFDKETLCQIFDLFIEETPESTIYDFSILERNPKKKKAINANVSDVRNIMFKKTDTINNNNILYHISEAKDINVFENRLVSKMIETNFFIYRLILILFLFSFPSMHITVLLLTLVNATKPFEKLDVNLSHCSSNCSTFIGCNREISLIENKKILFLVIISLIIASLVIVKEIFQFLTNPRSYLSPLHEAIMNAIEIASALLSLIYFIPLNNKCCENGMLLKEPWQSNIGAIAILFSSINFMFAGMKIIESGKYVVMIFGVLYQIISFLFMYLPVYLGFVFAFHIVFDLPDFNFHNVFIRVLFMMTGSFDIMEHTTKQTIGLNLAIQYILLILFLLFMNFVIMNMIVGLAISNNQQTINSKCAHMQMRIQLLLLLQAKLGRWEKRFFNFNIKLWAYRRNFKIIRNNDKFLLIESSAKKDFKLNEDAEVKNDKKVLRELSSIRRKLMK